jgi:nucleoid-associated protein YgaU
MREIEIRPPVTFPALGTDVPERPYSFVGFLAEWVMSATASEMRTDTNLPHFFEWEAALDALSAKIAAKVPKPELPVRAEGASEAEKAAHAVAAQGLVSDYQAAAEAATVGEVLRVSEDAWAAAKGAAKKAIDLACNPQGARLHPAIQPKVLRHYHALAQAKTVDG